MEYNIIYNTIEIIINISDKMSNYSIKLNEIFYECNQIKIINFIVKFILFKRDNIIKKKKKERKTNNFNAISNIEANEIGSGRGFRYINRRTPNFSLFQG